MLNGYDEFGFLEPAPEGKQFALAGFDATYNGAPSATPPYSYLSLLGSSGVAANLEITCSVIADVNDTLNAEVFTGGTVHFEICYLTTPDDAATAVIAASDPNFDRDPLFLALY